jgi:hypothetical protein
MHLNINRIVPLNYKHADTFLEIIDLLKYTFTELNYKVNVSINTFVEDATNIIIGGHLLNTADISNIPSNSILRLHSRSS